MKVKIYPRIVTRTLTWAATLWVSGCPCASCPTDGLNLPVCRAAAVAKHKVNVGSKVKCVPKGHTNRMHVGIYILANIYTYIDSLGSSVCVRGPTCDAINVGIEKNTETICFPNCWIWENPARHLLPFPSSVLAYNKAHLTMLKKWVAAVCHVNPSRF